MSEQQMQRDMDRMQRELSRLGDRVPLRLPPATGGFEGEEITQAGHGLSVGQWVLYGGGTWATAAATRFDYQMGVVVRVFDANRFLVGFRGWYQISPAPGVDFMTYVQDPTTPGASIARTAVVSYANQIVTPVLFHAKNGWVYLCGGGSLIGHQHALFEVQGYTLYGSDTYAGPAPRFLHYAGNTNGADKMHWQSACVFERTASAPPAGVLMNNGAGWISSVIGSVVSTTKIGVYTELSSASGVEYGVALAGPVEQSSITPGAVYYLDPAVAGGYTTTQPTNPDQRRIVGYGGEHNILWLAGTSSDSTVSDNSITNAKLRDSVGTSVIGRSAGTTGDPADIAAGADDLALVRVSGTLQWLQISTAIIANGAVTATKLASDAVTTVKILDANVTSAKLRDSAAVSVIGRAANSTGVPADITAGADDRVLARSSSALSFVQVTAGMIATDAVTSAKIIADAVTTVKVLDANVTNAKLDDIITAGGPTGSSSVVPVITYNVKGRLTAVTTATITPASIGAASSSHTHSLAGDVGGTTAASVIQPLAVVTGMIAAAAVTSAKLRDSVGVSVIGRSANSTGVPADITASADNKVLCRKASAVGFNDLNLDDLADVSVATPAAWDVPAWDGSSAWGKVSLTEFVRQSTYGAATSYTANGTHTFTSGKKWAIFEIIGGGGGGAGGSAATGSNSFGGYGGGQAERTYVLTPITAATAAVVVGAAGTAGSLPNGGGGNGGDSTVTMNAVVFTAKAGSGGNNGGFGAAGYGGDSAGIVAAVGFTINVPGETGELSRIASVTYNGTGNVSAVSASGGNGGGASSGASNPGEGGAGGNATSAGVAGIAGRVKVWEA